MAIFHFGLCDPSNARGRFMLLLARNGKGRGEAEERSMGPRDTCPQCGSRWYKRNRHIHTGKQNHRCKWCGRTFVLHPENHVITEKQRTLVERLLLERISLCGIC